MSQNQLALSLPMAPALGREDFVVAPNNQDAVAWIDAWPHWPIGGLVFYGPGGAGKSHLAAAWAKAAQAAWIYGPDLTMPMVPLALGAPAYVIDEADRVPDPRALLHLLNAAREAGAALILTAREAPSRWQAPLPDLSSRLKAMSAVLIGEADDHLRAAILVKLFADRQVRISEDLAQFLMARLERTVEALKECVALLDSRALASGRRITIPFAREVLDAQMNIDFLDSKASSPLS